MKHVTTFNYKGYNYEIVFTQGHYCAIDHKYIDSNGNLIRTLNGLQMCASRKLNECIKSIKARIDFDELKSEGVDDITAFQIIFNM